MNTLEKELSTCKIIDSFEKYDPYSELDKNIDKRILAKTKYNLTLTVTYRLVYKVGILRVIGYLSAPKRAQQLPSLIHLRGGSRDFGQLNATTICRDIINYAAQGYVVISTQYPGVEGGDGVDDWGGKTCLNSIKILRSILKNLSAADETNIGIKGHSRGGTMCYMLLRDVRWIKAAVIGAASANQARQAKERRGWRKHQISLWGSSREETIKRSAIYWANELTKKTPLLLLHGTSDWRVSALDSIEMSAELYKHKIPHRLVIFEGADHGISEYRGEYVSQTLEWFERFLKNKEPLPNMKLHGR